uniref:OCEL domain-containing protein n=1 Tax=Acrobeloides nanus TaxID=290746 RepID=A0A914E8I7_9BILA
MLFTPFGNGARKRKFHIIHHPEEEEPRSLSAPALLHPQTSTHISAELSSVGSSHSAASARSGPILRVGHWALLGEGILAKPLSPSEVKEALEKQNTNQSYTNIQSPLKNMADSETNNNGAGDTNPTEQARVPDSPGSRSHYDEFYWDTNGEPLYNTYPYDSELYDIEPELFGRSAARIGRTQEDLNKYRQRIDANVDQQKEFSQIMAAMQNKLAEYRKHIEMLQSKLMSQRIPTEPTDTTLFPLHDSGLGDLTDLYGGRRVVDANSNYDFIIRLEEERR